MKQTAVEWLVEKLKSQGLLIGEIENLVAVKEAKAMEKEQIIDAYYQIGKDHQDMIFPIEKNAEQYYTETYESNICLLNDGCDGIRCYNCINNRNL